MIEREYTAASLSNVSPWRKRIFWSPIISGVLIALMIEIILALLGIAIFSGFAPQAADAGNIGPLGIGAGLWWFVSSLIALFFGGWVAGRMSDISDRMSGSLHGILTWSICTLLLLLFLTTSVGALIGGTFQLLSVGASVASPAIARSMDMGGMDAGEANNDPQIRDMMNKLITQGPNSINREDFVNLLMARGNMSRAEAERRVDDITNRYNQAMGNTKDMGANAARTGAVAALASFFMLIIGAAVAGLGGWLGVEEYAAIKERKTI